MSDSTLLVITALSLLLTVCTVLAYERHLTRLRWELEEAKADADLAVDLLVEQAKQRHPAGQYGGGNLRIVR
jgi:hypothetical protein